VIDVLALGRRGGALGDDEVVTTDDKDVTSRDETARAGARLGVASPAALRARREKGAS